MDKIKSEDPKEYENELAVELILRNDMLFQKYGIEENQLKSAVKHYEINQD